MADTILTAEPILGGVNVEIAGCQLVERDDLALVSIAIPVGGDKAVAAGLKSGFGLEMPKPTRSTVSGDIRAIRSGADQMLLLFPHATPDAEVFVAEKTERAGYTTDQTDVWVRLELSGPNARMALERLCMLDLDDAAFPIDASGRTVMEHMGAFIIRTGKDAYLLMSASSSAKSFLHAVETSLHYVA